jgi:hypothetical protein
MDHVCFNWKPLEIMKMSRLYFYSVILFLNIIFIVGKNTLRRSELEEDVAHIIHGEVRNGKFYVDFCLHDIAPSGERTRTARRQRLAMQLRTRYRLS